MTNEEAPPPSIDYAPPDDPLDILYDDADILVLNKPAGLLSVPGRGAHLADCLLKRAQAVFPTALLVHRLDRDTSGVMIFAQTPHAQRHLSMQFEKRLVRKTYIARVLGLVAQNKGVIDLPIIVDWPNRPKQKICHETGRPAITEYRVQRRLADETLLRLLPKTGRSHQLRLHCQTIGHPILGDPFYAPNPEAHPRLMLHAQELALKHPQSGRGLRFRTVATF